MSTTKVTTPTSTAATTYLRAWPDDVVARLGKLSKALQRLVQFGYLKPFGGAVEDYWVRTHVAPLSERHLGRAGPRVRQLHDHLMAGKTAR